MEPEKERYVLRGGKAGYDRLLVLGRKSWPATLALLQRAGLGSGMRCLDVGCGGGAVSMELARLVGSGGAVTGIDMDSVQLGLARNAAAEAGLRNVEFRPQNANEWNEPGAYDIVYSRFLLQHLSQPVDLLRRMWAGVRSGGRLIVEDADFEGWCCEPPHAAFEFFVETYLKVARRNGGDATAGRKLYRYFREAGIPEPRLWVAQPVALDRESRSLLPSTLDYSREAIVAAGIASDTEVRAAVAELEKLVEDPTTLVTGPRVFQAWVPRAPLPSSATQA